MKCTICGKTYQNMRWKKLGTEMLCKFCYTQIEMEMAEHAMKEAFFEYKRARKELSRLEKIAQNN